MSQTRKRAERQGGQATGGLATSVLHPRAHNTEAYQLIAASGKVALQSFTAF